MGEVEASTMESGGMVEVMAEVVVVGTRLCLEDLRSHSSGYF